MAHGTALSPFVAHYLVAQADALDADPHIIGPRHGLDMLAALSAEAAAFVTSLVIHLPDCGYGSACRLAGRGQHRMDAVNTTVADIAMRPDDQLLDLLLVLPAERARKQVTEAGPAAAPASASPGRFHDLMNALVTDAEFFGYLAQRSSGKLEPAYRPVELGAGDFGVMLSIDEASLGGPRLT